LAVLCLAHHSDSAPVLCACCRAVYLLANDIPENHQRMGSAGACEAVVQTLRNFQSERDVQGFGWLAVAHLACLVPSNRERLVGVGAGRTLEEAALAFQGDAEGLDQVIKKASHQLFGGGDGDYEFDGRGGGKNCAVM